MYRYFIQPQLNIENQMIFGYELLLKEYGDDGWKIPKSFSDVPAKVIASTLVNTVSKLALKTETISVNVDRHQLQDRKLIAALIVAQRLLTPIKLIVELTEHQITPILSDKTIISTAQYLYSFGIQFSLDDVGSGVNTWPKIEPLMPFICEIKYALQNQDESFDQVIVQQDVDFWQSLAQKYSIRFILEGIDNTHDHDRANRMQINLRQGYYYGKPRLMRITRSDPK